MAGCLGVYIENNLIKYAKVSKNNETVKVEAFGVKFYDNIENAIKQIIDETYSYKLPISINITGEVYNKFEVFSLLSKKDIDAMVKTEFENICYEKEINKNIYEERYIFANSNNNNEKVKVIHVSAPKTTIAQRKNQFTQSKISSISPIGLTIQNIVKKEKRGNYIVVNIENETTITKVINNTISDVEVLEIGAKDILSNINSKENSYQKAYEICKNVTIYTENDKDLQYEENEYLEDVMPTLYKIVSEVRNSVDNSFEEIEKVYITGTGAIINNIDIYFQDYLKNNHCEILKPGFVGNNSKINIKDYIEVNSAISLALQGIEKSTVNFTNEPVMNKILIALSSDVSKKEVGGAAKGASDILDKFSKHYTIGAITFGFLTALYIISMVIINNQLDSKIALTEKSITDTNARIEKVKEYNTKFNDQITEYERLITNIENINDANSEDKRFKNTIPNLLNNIMVIIPKGVQLTSIENTSGARIVINASSENYEQAAFFKAKLKTEGILKNVVSDTGTVSGDRLNITIEGELP